MICVPLINFVGIKLIQFLRCSLASSGIGFFSRRSTQHRFLTLVFVRVLCLYFPMVLVFFLGCRSQKTLSSFRTSCTMHIVYDMQPEKQIKRKKQNKNISNMTTAVTAAAHHHPKLRISRTSNNSDNLNSRKSFFRIHSDNNIICSDNECIKLPKYNLLSGTGERTLGTRAARHTL